MKILRAITTLDPEAGGPIEFVRQTNKILSKEGHIVDVVTLDDPQVNWASEVIPLGPGRTHYKYSSRYIPWLRSHVNDYDAILVHGIWQYTSFGVWRALRNAEVPYFVFTHGMLDPWFKYEHPLKHLKKWIFWPWSDYRVLRDAARVFFTTEEERERARDSFWLYKCNEQVVRYGTKGPEGDPQTQIEAFFKKFPVLSDKKIFLFMGRLHRKKGCDLLLKAFDLVSERDNSLHLVIAGPDQGGLKRELENIAAKLDIGQKVTWTGMLENDQKWGALRASEIFVLPSHQENFGLVVAEALSCGTPVITTKKVNIWRELLRDNAGFAGEDTEQGVKNLLNQWMNLSLEEKEQLRLNARKCFEEKFDINVNIHGLLKIIRQEIEDR